MLVIKQSVGHRGRNQPHDVAVVQYLLRRLSRFKDGKPYFKGRISGVYDGPLSGAVLTFYRDFPGEIGLSVAEQKDYAKNERTFTPQGVLFKWLSTWVADDPVVKNGAVIPGMPILYMPRQTRGRRREAKEYLIPDFLQLPRVFKLGTQSFDSRIDSVEFYKPSPTNHHFEVCMTLRSIGEFIDSNTLAKTTLATTSIRKLLQRQLKGKDWELLSRQDRKSEQLKSHLCLRSRNISEFGPSKSSAISVSNAIGQLTPTAGVGRVYWDGLRKSYKIPSKDAILNVVGRIHAEACANSGSEGGYVSNKPLETYATSVLERELGKHSVNSQKRFCESCQVLAAKIIDSRERGVELLAKMESLKVGFQRFMREETSADAFRQAQEELASSAANLVPIVGNELFNVAQTDNERLADKAADTAEIILNIDNALGRLPKYADATIKTKSQVDVLIAMADFTEVIYYLAATTIEEEKIRRRFELFQLHLYNLWLELEAEDVKVRAWESDFSARKCGDWLLSQKAGQDF